MRSQAYLKCTPNSRTCKKKVVNSSQIKPSTSKRGLPQTGVEFLSFAVLSIACKQVTSGAKAAYCGKGTFPGYRPKGPSATHPSGDEPPQRPPFFSIRAFARGLCPWRRQGTCPKPVFFLPIAWQHINLHGRYEFKKPPHPLDADAIIREMTEFRPDRHMAQVA
jgi:hypothetical protein